MLRRLHGHDAAPGHGLWAAPRVRHFQAGDPGRLATRAAGQLAAPPGPVGGRPPERDGRHRAQLFVRGARRDPACRCRPAIAPVWAPLRSPRGGVRRQDHQHAPALVRRGAGLFRLPGLQPRRVRRGAGRDARSRIPHPSPVSGRLHQHGSGPALRAGVLSGCLLAGRSGAALPPQQCRLERAPREGRHSAQRHAPRHGRSRADADPARRGAPRMGRGLGSHPPGARLHEPHALARGSGEVASGVVRNDVAAPPGDHLRDQPPLPRRGPRPVPRRWRASRACEPRRRERRAQDPHGQPRDRRLPQHQRRGRHSLRVVAHDDGPGPGRDVPGALQQQDQRRHAAALAPAGQPGARPNDHGGHRRRLDHGSESAPAPRAARRRRRLPR